MNSFGRFKVGVFDSGLGGLSVLRTIWKETNNIDFIYLADLDNSPYGSKSKRNILQYSKIAYEYLVDKNCDAVVFACNTATSAAAEILRSNSKIPIIGMEPAVKPAVIENPNQSVAVFATDLTLKEEKFQNLVSSFSESAEIIPVSCEGLAKLIDNDLWDEAWDFFNTRIKSVISKTKIFVLGCTHYVFLKERILYNYPDVKIYDGNLGTNNRLKDVLNISQHSGNDQKNGLDILLNTSNSDYVHLTGRIAKTISSCHTVSLINTNLGKIHA
ncbi:glutamate racemase [Leptospira sp. 96542]|nr:glutamate racemase [Leptospira sp. 96542]